ncbi:hypothetical protein A4G27_24335 [Mycobacterium kansasii]|nr:hypothetical protein A4G27_24335 [Mycobacterium kansasii]
MCGLLAQNEEHREAILSAAEARGRETLTRRELADFHARSAAIKDLQECVIDADALIADLAADPEVQPDCGATQPD